MLQTLFNVFNRKQTEVFKLINTVFKVCNFRKEIDSNI